MEKYVDQVVTGTRLSTMLKVSRTTLWKWRNEGMPAIINGRSGLANQYSLAAVVRWLDETGRGQEMRADNATASRIQILREAINGAAHPSEHGVSSVVLGKLLGNLFAASVVPGAALIMNRNSITAEVALEICEDMMLIQMGAAAKLLNLGEDFSVLVPEELEALLDPALRSRVVEKITQTAPMFNEGVSHDGDGKVSDAADGILP